jgi:hypothetical protein
LGEEKFHHARARGHPGSFCFMPLRIRLDFRFHRNDGREVDSESTNSEALGSKPTVVQLNHRIILVARANRFGSMVTPICLAVLRFTTSSNLIGCSTGKSAGLVSFRILSTKYATRR